jgi:competence protein ComEC
MRRARDRGALRPRLRPALGHACRFAALGGLASGLALSPLGPESDPSTPATVALAAAAAAVASAPRRSRLGAGPIIWLLCVALAAGLAGLALGSARLAAIDSGALDLAPGREVSVRGFVIAVPRRADGTVDVQVGTPEGRLLVSAPEPVVDLPVGGAVRASGTIRDPDDFDRARLERLGISDTLAAREIEPVAGRRGGVTGALDEIRRRAEAALGSGTDPRAASLLRGFVLGQDDRIDEPTVDDFKRSGLAHLLAVSGQNVVLLAILAGFALAVIGVPLRARLGWILLLIAIYVPVTGAGPSIQRAGVMGAAGVVAALAGRPRSRWYALLLAAAVTLAVDPRASADVGWQLSFAAVIGILLFAAPIVAALGATRTPWRRALIEAGALTVAATIATAPLMAFHFETLSLVSLPANLLAVPAEAPVMWLGMLAAAVGQLPWLPVEPITWLAGTLAGYIAQIAAWSAAPAWAQIDVGLAGPLTLAGTYVGAGAGLAVALRQVRRRAALRARPAGSLRARLARPAVIAPVLALAAALALLAIVRPGGDQGPGAPPDVGLRLTVLDVGQGDAALLEPADGDPVLVDSGPAAANVVEALEAHGVDRLAALVITHPEADHDGGAASVLARLPVGRLVFARARRSTLGVARAARARPTRVAEGARLRSGSLRLEVLWPPRERLTAPGLARDDANLLSLVMLARWRGFEALLTGDAEAEAAPVSPGEVDVLKVAHHGSEDAGLERLLDDTDPRLAVISAGADNPYGHPAPSTVAELEAAGTTVMRTDRDGEVEVDVAGGAWTVR